jgi:hypothetical protein
MSCEIEKQSFIVRSSDKKKKNRSCIVFKTLENNKFIVSYHCLFLYCKACWLFYCQHPKDQLESFVAYCLIYYLNQTNCIIF